MPTDPEINSAPEAAAPASAPEPVEAEPFIYPPISTMQVFEGSQPSDEGTIQLTAHDDYTD